MKIRKCQEKDRDILINLWEEAFPDGPPYNEPSKVIGEKLAVDDLIFIAADDEGIAGACIAGYDGHRGWLYAVAVSEDRRRDGIGTSLVKHTVNSLKELGCIKVNVQVRATNKTVVDFYKRLGFAVEDRVSMGVLVG
ncbi:MAG: GNAT family acetyltransferase [Deltaproteobacteria bacterium]|nr:GNAT family acetyltransferase [Deltaproteobacteria bacterium]MBW1847572.1 GNAT family acetyltransferase [Deltaproteobacteria bacterium]